MSSWLVSVSAVTRGPSLRLQRFAIISLRSRQVTVLYSLGPSAPGTGQTTWFFPGAMKVTRDSLLAGGPDTKCRGAGIASLDIRCKHQPASRTEQWPGTVTN